MKTISNQLIFIALSLLFTTLYSCKQEISKEIPDSFKVAKLLERGEKIQLGKEWDFAQNFYMDKKTAIEKDPQDFQSHVELAQLFIKEARITGEHGHYYPGALALLDKILASKSIDDNNKFVALMTKAGVQLSLHEFSDALQTGLLAVSLNPRNAQIHGVLVDCYVELGQYDKAIKLADKMTAMKPDLRSYSRISYLREIHGDVKGAKQALTLAVESGYPGTEETAWAMLTLGELYLAYGELESAKKIFSQILLTRENYPFAVSALGQVAYEEGNLEEAERYFLQAIDIIPEVGYYISLAQIFKDQNRSEELEAISKEILIMLEDDVNSGHNMNLEYAHFYLDILDDHEKALKFAGIEYNKRPENIDVNRVMAKIHLALENTTLAESFVLVAQKTSSMHPELRTIKSALN